MNNLDVENISPEYPLNLLLAVDNKYKTYFIPPDIDETIEYLMHVVFFSVPNEAEILRKHFKYGNTYVDIAYEYQDTEEHIHQMVNRAIGRLQYSACIECLQTGIYQIIMRHCGYSCFGKTTDFVIPFTEIDMVNLSVRCNNCLRRAGIRTIGDLEKLTTKQLKNIDGLGQKSYDEILNMLKTYNIMLREE